MSETSEVDLETMGTDIEPEDPADAIPEEMLSDGATDVPDGGIEDDSGEFLYDAGVTTHYDLPDPAGEVE